MIGRFAATLFAVCLGILTSYEPALAQTTASARIDLLSGTGFPGYADGPADRATFLLPSAVAFAADGTLYVADAAAQRIRAISPTGFVRTIAGGGELTDSGLWVDGGFRDGAAFSARFNRPYGIAVRPDGAIYVADTFNHCIRLLSAGIVSTAAGTCGTAGSADGSARSARLQYPRALALGANGVLYIADQRNGIRALDRSATLTTLQFPPDVDVKLASGLAFVNAGNDFYLYVADADRLIRYDLGSGKALVASDINARLSTNSTQGGAPLGHPYAVVALSPNTVVYSDLLDGALRYVEDFVQEPSTALPYPQYIGATPPEDALLGLTHRQSGRSFSGPMGIALSPDGRIAIADAIQRRIFRVALTEYRHAYNVPAQVTPFQKTAYNIVLQGDYLSWFATGFGDSIAGRLEKRLRQDRDLRAKNVHVVPLHIPCLDARWAAANKADLVVFFTSAYLADCDGQPRFGHNPLLTQKPGAWQRVARDRVLEAAATLGGAHIPGLIVLMPLAWEVAPNEQLYRVEGIGYDPAITSADFAFASDYSAPEQNLAQAFTGAKIDLLNLFPIFRSYERSAHADSLYATEDLQASARGRDLIAGSIAAYVEKRHPWRR